PLDIVNLEAVALQIGNRHADVVELATRKNVAPYRSGRLRLLFARALVRGRPERDGMMKVEPARLQQPVDGLEIRRVIRHPDMLEHADRGNLVELAFDL